MQFMSQLLGLRYRSDVSIDSSAALRWASVHRAKAGTSNPSSVSIREPCGSRSLVAKRDTTPKATADIVNFLAEVATPTAVEMNGPVAS